MPSDDCHAATKDKPASASARGGERQAQGDLARPFPDGERRIAGYGAAAISARSGAAAVTLA
jgi:hypothetical protein